MVNPESLLTRPPPTEHCTLSCPILDRTLHSGIPCSSVTELVSESGTGKTQLCLQLSLSAQLPQSHGGLNASAIYIHTESQFPSQRLHTLSQSFMIKHAPLFQPHYDPCHHVHVRKARDAEELLDALRALESALFGLKRKVGLVVVDSVAAVFRCDDEDYRRRAGVFFVVSRILRELAVRFGLAVVVTNQVVDEGFGGGVRVGNLRELWSSGRRVGAALGLAWANCVNSRLFLSKDVGGTRRRLQVVFAPHLPASECEFVIRHDGVFGVEDNEDVTKNGCLV